MTGTINRQAIKQSLLYMKNTKNGCIIQSPLSQEKTPM